MMALFKPSEWSTAFRLTISFVLVAAAGSFVLALPVMHKPYLDATYFDHLLTAVSLICVSGMAALPIGESYNMLGQVVALIMIQVGGLGVITIVNMGLYYLQRRIPLKDQYILQAALNRDTNADFLNFLISIYRFTFIVELLAASVIMIDFVPRYGWFNGTFNAIFLSISAFTNSGFDNVGTNDMATFIHNPLILIILKSLFIAGGLGFSVWFELRERLALYFKRQPRSFRLAFRKMSTNTRLVLQMTAILLIGGMILIWIGEVRNPLTLGILSFGDQMVSSFFKSASTRTAGYATFAYQDTTSLTKFVYMILTVIGGAPGGTAGGIKITTVAIIALLFRAELQSYSQVVYNKRTIPSTLVRQSVMIVLFFGTLGVVGYASLLLSHPHLSTLDLLFETASAMGTLGVSLNVTDQLNMFGRVVLMILTLAGRVGPITLLLAILQRKQTQVNYAKTDVLIG